tara:strand:+ start:57 stop:293 length:237 start_codon:yes stop_codon:yes gene_type:complete
VASRQSIASIEDSMVIELILKHLKRPSLMPPNSANYQQSGHYHGLSVGSSHLRVGYLINPLKAYTASFSAAGRATGIQ